MVYPQLLVKEQKVNRAKNDALHLLRNGPERSLLRVNRQFKDEYEECALNHATLAMMDTGDFLPPISLIPPLPDFIQKIKWTEITVLVPCVTCDDYNGRCGAASLLDLYASWIKSLSRQLKKSKSIIVKIDVNTSRIVPQGTFGKSIVHLSALAQMERMFSISNLSSLALHKLDYDHGDPDSSLYNAIAHDFSETTLRAIRAREDPDWKAPNGESITMK